MGLSYLSGMIPAGFGTFPEQFPGLPGFTGPVPPPLWIRITLLS